MTTSVGPGIRGRRRRPGLTVGTPSIATAVSPTKVNVMGLWAHPDDDAGFTTPCGVWQDLYDVTCGIIMETRGEGGSNSVGPEAGPDLGLRRENEDRTSHVRSGTVNIYNVDRVDFFYNTSAPLTAQVWDKEEGLRQTVGILRETQPDILMASSPAASRPRQPPVRAGPHGLGGAARPPPTPPCTPSSSPVRTPSPRGRSRRSSAVARPPVPVAPPTAPNCTTGFVPAANNPYTAVGVWTGYDSPYTWAEGNVQGQPAGTRQDVGAGRS